MARWISLLGIAGGTVALVLQHFTHALPPMVGTALFFVGLAVAALQRSLVQAQEQNVRLTWAAVLVAVGGAFLGPDAVTQLPAAWRPVIEFAVQFLTLLGAGVGGRLLGAGPSAPAEG